MKRICIAFYVLQKCYLKFNLNTIGSTATPDKAVAGYGLLRLYFGNEKHFIVRREVKNFTVHKIETNYKPVVEYVYRQGRSSPDWNLIVDTIEKNEERWKKHYRRYMFNTSR